MRRVLPVLVLLCAACQEITGGGGGDHYKASFSGITYTESQTSPRKADGSGGVTCVTTYALKGGVDLKVDESNGNVTGEGTANFDEAPLGVTPTECGIGPHRSFDVGGAITGTTSNFQFFGQHSSSGAGVIDTSIVHFTGSLSGASGSGNITLSYRAAGVGQFAGSTGSGGASFGVTISR